MLLALVFGAGNQCLGIKPFRLTEYRPCDVNAVVAGHLPCQRIWRVWATSELSCELRPRTRFDLLRETTDDLAKGPDLLFGIGAGDQNVCCVPERPQTTLGISPRNRFV